MLGKSGVTTLIESLIESSAIRYIGYNACILRLSIVWRGTDIVYMYSAVPKEAVRSILVDALLGDSLGKLIVERITTNPAYPCEKVTL